MSSPADYHSVTPTLPFFNDDWALWTMLLACAALGQLSDSRSKIGSLLGGPLVSMLCAVALAAAGIIPTDAPSYDIVWKYLMPLAAGCFLVDVDITRLFRSGGPVLAAFLLGAVGMVVGAVAGYTILKFLIGSHQASSIAACLCASYVGGSINFVAVSQVVQLDPSLIPAAMAADNLAMAAYLAILMAIPTAASKVVTNYQTNNGASMESAITQMTAPRVSNDPDLSQQASLQVSIPYAHDTNTPSGLIPITSLESGPEKDIVVPEETATSTTEVTTGSISLSLACAATANSMAVALAAAAPILKPLTLTMMAVIAIGLSVLIRALLRENTAGSTNNNNSNSSSSSSDSSSSSSSSSVMGLDTANKQQLASPFTGSSQVGGALMLVFFSVIGASAGSLHQLPTCWSMMVFLTIMVAVHWAVLFSLGAAFGLPTQALLLGSNANIGGPATAASMALSRGWGTSMSQTAMLVGSLGYAVGTSAGLLVGKATSMISGQHAAVSVIL
ncbi:hypothetical protein CEUSTIGMA_g5523.t1 [Chlamydomonas eustigma]|uniref:DUF819 protein n=1 Tax=Chlamydomonas eustigma TaxID=1157962 RepID=A0A250X4U4_9CHLO|nr:hypothetical protein CEUSTIGMA_g5523.t1 [Chlamydomonas eustigma]|eukprot:GAX78081.1 hypothetical protein CEUSTIGMA_g5523.t1 [Chlamydomonas eustigma]